MAKSNNIWGHFRVCWRLQTVATKTKPWIESWLAPYLQRAKEHWPFMTANIITALRAFPAWLAYVLFTADEPYPAAAAGVYLITALMDWLDGAWARANGENSGGWGKAFDPLVDKMIVLGWQMFFAFQGIFSWGLFWTMAGMDAFSTLIYFVRFDRLEGANWFGGAKKAVQDACVLLAILGWISLATDALMAAIALSVASSLGKLLQSRAQKTLPMQQQAP